MTLPNESNPTRGTNGQSYEWLTDVAPMPPAGVDPTYIHYPDVTALVPSPTLTKADGTTYANKGKSAQSVVGEDFTLAFDGLIVRNAQGVVHPAMALMIASANAHLEGGDPSKKIIMARAYHHWIPELAWEFSAQCEWARKSTGNAENEFLSITMSAQGDRKVIPNPALGAPVLPTITSATPAEAAEDEFVQIEGAGLTNVIGVTFGGIASPAFTTSAGVLFAQMPAGSAGAAAIVVTTVAGQTAPFSYTRGA